MQSNRAWQRYPTAMHEVYNALLLAHHDACRMPGMQAKHPILASPREEYSFLEEAALLLNLVELAHLGGIVRHPT